MNKKLAKRYFLCILGLFIAGVGVAITKNGELGVSPITSVANVLSIRFDSLTLGNWLIVTNCVLILGQIILLRKKFKVYQFLQIPLSFLFGYFTDFGMWLMSFVEVNSYAMQIALVFIGTLVLGVGIAFSVIADVILNSGEAFVKAISDTFHKEFGNVKVCFDVSCVVLSIILSFVFFNFRLVGTREGTVITALLTGFVVKFFSKKFRKIGIL